MRLSDIKGEHTFDVIADIIAPVARIARDENAKGIFQRKKVPSGMTEGDYFAKRVEENLPSLLKGHKEDFIAIMCALNGTSREEYVKGLNMASLFRDVIEMMTDTGFESFFS